MKVIVDNHKCVGAGQCVLAAPEIFDQRDDDGLVTLLQESPGPQLREAVQEAVHACPALAITLDED